MGLNQNSAVEIANEEFDLNWEGDEALISTVEKIKISQVMNRQIGRIELDDESMSTQSKIWAAGQRYACVFSDKTMVGVIDIFRAIKHAANDPVAADQSFDWRVGVVSGSDYWNCSPETDADVVYNAMKANDVECIPIFDEQAVVGVATKNDLEKIFEN